MSNDKLDWFNPPAESAAPALSPFEMDADKYMPEMDGFDMAEAQKLEFLQTLWSIMRSFVELGFTPPDICEQIFENGEPDVDATQDAVKSPSTKEIKDEG
jgi:hypothetical protein